MVQAAKQNASYKTVHATSIADPIEFWGEQAKLIHWEKPFNQVLDLSLIHI